MKKIVVIGIICLFIGVSFQSVIGVETETPVVDNQIEDDCDCEEIDRINDIRVNFLLKRVAVVTNILMSRYEHIPEIKEKGQELLANIDSNNQLYFPIFCTLLENLYYMFLSYIAVTEQFVNDLLENRRFILAILLGVPLYCFHMPALGSAILLWVIGVSFDCWDYP